jgi:hypothetical protein
MKAEVSEQQKIVWSNFWRCASGAPQGGGHGWPATIKTPQASL